MSRFDRVMDSPVTGFMLAAMNMIWAFIVLLFCPDPVAKMLVAGPSLVAAWLAGSGAVKQIRRREPAVVVSLDDAYAGLEKALAQTRAQDKRLATDRVEAFTYCPHCGRHAYHSMRAAKPLTDDEVYHALGEVSSDWWMGESVQIRGNTYPPSVNRIREADFEIVRTCDCGAEWGQK